MLLSSRVFASGEPTEHPRPPHAQGSLKEVEFPDPRTSQKKAPMLSGILPEKQLEGPGQEVDMRIKPDHGEDTYVGHNHLLGKRALITGGDSGIGKAVALAFAREGADVACAYLNEHEDAKDTKRLVEAAGRRCVLVAADLAEGEDACRRVVDAAVQGMGGIDILVNNAAIMGKQAQSVEEYDYNRVLRTYLINNVAPLTITKYALPHMKEGASIIISSSVEAWLPVPGVADYASSKGALVSITKALADELTQSRGIRVNAVAPGFVWTPFIPQSLTRLWTTASTMALPYGRPGQPSEMAPGYVFLASNEASYVSGEVLNISGGMPTA